MFVLSEEVDRRLSWPLGRAERLARRRKLPHVILPDGSIRFEWGSIEETLKRVDADSLVQAGQAPHSQQEAVARV